MLQGRAATDAWAQWQAQTDLDQLDYGSVRLLPLLYHNLRAHEIEHPWMGKCKGLYRRTWYQNQMLLHHAAALLPHLHAAGIETLLLKGAALVLLHYRNLGLRPMDDLDLLVPTHQATAAEDLLRKLGWTSNLPPPHLAADFASFWHAAHFKDRAGRAIDLHWHVLHRVFETGSDDEFWAGRVPVRIGDVVTTALNPTDQLLHACQHGAEYNDVPPLRWIADAVFILRTSPELDWNRFLAQAQRHHLVLPLRETLRYLRETLAPAIPLTVLQELQSQPTSKTEQRTFQSLTSRPDKQGSLLLAWYLSHTAIKLLRDANGWRTLKALLLISQQNHRIDRFWAVPFYIAYRWMRRISLSFLRSL